MRTRNVVGTRDDGRVFPQLFRVLPNFHENSSDFSSDPSLKYLGDISVRDTTSAEPYLNTNSINKNCSLSQTSIVQATTDWSYYKFDQMADYHET